MLTPVNQIIILMELLLPPTMVLSKLNTKNKKHYTSAISRSKMKTLSNTIHLENQFTNLSPPDLFIILKVSLCTLFYFTFTHWSPYLIYLLIYEKESFFTISVEKTYGFQLIYFFWINKLLLRKYHIQISEYFFPLLSR